jgi:hypothetical protein
MLENLHSHRILAPSIQMQALPVEHTSGIDFYIKKFNTILAAQVGKIQVYRKSLTVLIRS